MSTIEREEKKIVIKMDEIYIEAEDILIGALLYLNEEGINAKFLGFDNYNRAIVSVDEKPYSFVTKGSVGRGLDMVQVFHLLETDVPVNPEKSVSRVNFILKKYAVHYERRFGKSN